MKTLLKALGPVSAVIGAQWGDEGKGKVVDILSEHFDVIARACGGANAGHTIVVNGEKHVFHLLPSGCLHEGKPVVLGAGMVIHLPTLLEEIKLLEDAGISILDRLYISHSAHIVFEFHKEVDGIMEEWRVAEKGEGIGTTKRGIGPAYMDKAARTGIRMEHLGTSLEGELRYKSAILQKQFDLTISIPREMEHLAEAKEKLSSRIMNVSVLLHDALKNSKTVLIEGAQATLLDTDHGTYPFVTSSSTTAAGALQGLGLAPHVLTSCIGVAKAYCTRVGSGDFSTEAEPEIADQLRNKGGEFGATTGRPRRCGWLDTSDLRYAAMLNGFTAWNITKLDVLDEFSEIPISTGRDGEGRVHYEVLPGWQSSTVGMTTFSELPKEAQNYIRFIEKETDIPAALIGTGQGRKEMIVQ